MNYPLVPRDTLLQVKDELYARIAQLPPSVVTPGLVLIPEGVGEALAWALLFERWPELLPGSPVSPEDAFYNQYFWFRRFATLKQERDGSDAGLEQQVLRLLEHPGVDVDWALLEQIDAEASDTRS